MTGRSSTERILDAFLAPEADRLPDRVIDAALADIARTPQRRALRVPWRFPNMSNLSTSARTLLVGAVLLVAVVGGTLLIAGGQPVTPSEAPPTAGATPESPTAAPTVAFTAEFRSGAFGYEARLPIDWRATPGTTQGSADELALGGHDGPNPFWDQFTPSGQAIILGGLLATSSAVPPGVSEDDWIDAYQAPQIATLGQGCIPQRSTWESITVDGRAGGIYVGCQFVEAMVFADGRAYVFYYVNTQAAQSGVETTGRALLEAFLDTVSLDPDSAAPASPAPATSPAASAVTIDWRSYTSTIYGFEMAYPVSWSASPATRAWQSQDEFPVDGLPYADVFASPEQGDEQIALFAWEVPADEGADIASIPGLTVWAEQFCEDQGLPSCDAFAQGIEVMCHWPCAPAIVVTTAEHQYAFFETAPSAVGLEPPTVRVVVVARPDDFPAARPHGGSVALLKSVLQSMDVWEVGQQQN